MTQQVKLDQSKLLGFRIQPKKLGAGVGAKIGAKIGNGKLPPP